MPCFVGCLALFFPRVAIVLVWVLSDYLERAYASINIIWPILGFIFLPLTTLAYAFAWHIGNGTISGVGIVVIVLAVLIDIGTWGGSASNRRVRRYYVVRRVE